MESSVCVPIHETAGGVADSRGAGRKGAGSGGTGDVEKLRSASSGEKNIFGSLLITHT